MTRGPHREPHGDHLGAAHAEDGILNWRWWTPKEPADTTDALWPPQLPRLLAELDTFRPPA
ncbi:hypothetical protein [Streptomyces sp. NBC_00203]|uniref:hypothetical protein n=1 Tax=Streptomyces sp. NBC_00203 TaxID=2975680 RepID=UPI00324474B1